MFAKSKYQLSCFFYKFVSKNLKSFLLIGICIKITLNHSKKYSLSFYWMRLISINNDAKTIYYAII